MNLGIYGGISIYFLMRYRNSEFRNRDSDFLTLQTSEFKKKIRPESSESKTESELRLRWGSQKLEPKVGTPKQAKLGYNRSPTHIKLNLKHPHPHRILSRGQNLVPGTKLFCPGDKILSRGQNCFGPLSLGQNNFVPAVYCTCVGTGLRLS